MKYVEKHQQLFDTTINIAKREIKSRYADSFLGSLWSVIYPIIFAIITAVIFSYIFKGNVNNTPYFLFVLIGFDSWFWFSQTVVQTTRSPIFNRNLIVNNKFPTESIIFGMAIAKLPDYIISLIIFYILMALLRQNITFSSLFLIIFISICQFFFQIGISLLTSAVNIYVRDLQNIVEILLQLIFYATPVIYTIDIVPLEFQNFILINPVTHIITAYRSALFENYISLDNLIYVFLTALIMFIVGYRLYKKFEKKFAELL